jgi:L-ascorbate 6-phosphate lactonase
MRKNRTGNLISAPYWVLQIPMKNIYIIFVSALVIAGPAFCQESGRRMIDDIKGHQAGTALWWAGHNSWIIKSGDLVVTTDLYLENSLRLAPSPITPEEIASEVDISFVTHAHGDHFNEYTSRILLEKSSCIFVMPESCLPVATKLKIPQNRIVVARPRESFTVKGVKVDAIRAIHGNANFAIYYEANLQDCGYVFTVGGRTFLQPGDSYLLEDHLFLKNVDVLFFSPTEHNMYIDRSVILINALEPTYIFPQHHGTIAFGERDQYRFWAKGYPDEVKLRLSKGLKERYFILKPGDKRMIE